MAFATIVAGVFAEIAYDGSGLPQWALIGLVAWVPAIRPMERVGTATGRDLIPVLTGTAVVHAACGLATALGLLLATGGPCCHRWIARPVADTVHLGDLSLACAWALVDELVQGGVGEACLSPGSRSTPIALALARHPGVRLHIHLDERSSAFFALGLAKASRRPVIIACTSGTAAAEFLPALVEASRSRMPLLALTADRPPRLRGTGANQTIDQVGLYGGYVRECLDLPVPETPGQEAWWGQSARQALEASRTDPAGPVHVNCPFDEPLSPTPDVALPPPAHGVSPRRHGLVTGRLLRRIAPLRS